MKVLSRNMINFALSYLDVACKLNWRYYNLIDPHNALFTLTLLCTENSDGSQLKKIKNIVEKNKTKLTDEDYVKALVNVTSNGNLEAYKYLRKFYTKEIRIYDSHLNKFKHLKLEYLQHLDCYKHGYSIRYVNLYILALYSGNAKLFKYLVNNNTKYKSCEYPNVYYNFIAFYHKMNEEILEYLYETFPLQIIVILASNGVLHSNTQYFDKLIKFIKSQFLNIHDKKLESLMTWKIMKYVSYYERDDLMKILGKNGLILEKIDGLDIEISHFTYDMFIDSKTKCLKYYLEYINEEFYKRFIINWWDIKKNYHTSLINLIKNDDFKVLNKLYIIKGDSDLDYMVASNVIKFGDLNLFKKVVPIYDIHKNDNVFTKFLKKNDIIIDVNKEHYIIYKIYILAKKLNKVDIMKYVKPNIPYLYLNYGKN